MRPGTGFRVTLKAERRHIRARDTLHGAVEQRHMGTAQIVRQRFSIHRKAVVLAGDDHLPGILILHRVVGAMMAMGHLHGRCAAGRKYFSHHGRAR